MSYRNLYYLTPLMDFVTKISIIISIMLFFVINDTFSNKPNVINFYRDKYKAANKNWAIAQDTSGIVYFGNDKGLLEFDGIQWRLYSLPQAEVVRAVSISKSNDIFSGGYEEFGVWKRDISGELIYTSLSQNLKNGKDLRNDDIWRIYTTDSLVYFQSFGHIYEYDYKSIKVYNTGGNNLVFLIKVYDEFWVQKTGGELFKLAKKQLLEIPGSSFLGSTEIRAVLPFGNKEYLICTATKGFYVYNGETFRQWDSECSRIINNYQVNCGILQSNGNYFFGTILNGVYEVNPSGKIINNFSTANFLQNNTILGLQEDNNGNVWVAMDRGISYVQYLRGLDCYINPFGKIGALYSAAFFNDKLFIGTNQGVFYTTKEELNQPSSPSQFKEIAQVQSQVWDIKCIGDKLVCGYNYGLKVIDKNLNVNTLPVFNTGVYKITPMLYKGEDYLFLSTYYIAKVLSKNYDVVYKFLDIREPIISIEADHLGNIWLGHAQKGIYRCRLTGNIDKITYLNSYGGGNEDGLPFHLSLFKFGGRVLFLGNNKFYVYDDLHDKIVEYPEMNRCFEGINDLKKICPISNHLFFAIAGSCIYKVFYDGYELKIIDSFDVGYNNLSMVNMYENIVALDDTTSLICLDNGFLLHNNNQPIINKNITGAPQLKTVTTISAKNKRRYLSLNGKANQIPYPYNTIQFSFFSKNILADNLSFQYQLKGVSSNWSDPAKINEVVFERLPKGDYTFLLRTTDNLGNHSEPTSFSFTVLPPWYASPWTFIGYIFIFFIAMILIWFMILKRYRNVHLLKVRMREEQRLRRQNMNLQKEIEEKNEELFSQTSFIIQKNELIMKVKKEIDDFYNSYSGNRILKPLYQKVESLLNRNMDIEEDWKMFLIQFEQKHTGFFKHLKEKYPDLTPNDLKLCACLKLNLSSKDIASLLNISIRGVENSRYRLRKKLNISQDQNLNEFFMNF